MHTCAGWQQIRSEHTSGWLTRLTRWEAAPCWLRDKIAVTWTHWSDCCDSGCPPQALDVVHYAMMFSENVHALFGSCSLLSWSYTDTLRVLIAAFSPIDTLRVSQSSLPSTRFVSHSLLSHRHTSCLTVFCLLSHRHSSCLTVFCLLSRRHSSCLTVFSLLSRRHSSCLTVFSILSRRHSSCPNYNFLSHRYSSCLTAFSPIDTLRVLQPSRPSTLFVSYSLNSLPSTLFVSYSLNSLPSTLFVSYSLNSLPSTLFVSYSLNFLPSTLFVSYCLLPTTLFVSDSLLPIFTLRVLITTVSPPVILRVLQSSFSPTRTGHSWQNSLMLRTHSIPYLF